MSRIYDESGKAEEAKTTTTETSSSSGPADLDQPAAAPVEGSTLMLVEPKTEGHQKPLAELCSSAIEELQHKSDALESFQGQLGNTLRGLEEKGAKKTADQLQKLADGLLERSARQLQKQADDTVKKLSEELKASGTGLVQETKQQLVGLIQASRNIWTGIQRKSDTLLEGFQGQLQSTLNGFEQKGTQEIADRLQKIAEDLLERSARQFEKQADDAVEKLNEQLSGSGIGLVQETQKQLASIVQASLESLTKETQARTEEWRGQLAQTLQEHAAGTCQSPDAVLNSINLAAENAVAQLQAAGQKIEVSLETKAESHEKRWAELSTSALGELERKAATLFGGFQGHLRNALQDFEQKGANKVADELQKITDTLLERSATQLQQKVDDALGMLSEELRGSGTRLVQETHQQFTGITQGFLDCLSRQTTATAEECQSLEKKREAIQQRIDDFCKASLEKLRLDYTRLQDGPTPGKTGLKLGVKLGLKIALWLFAIVSTPLFIYLSTRPVMRLRQEPPAEFFDERDLEAAERATEDVLAQAYWDSAVRYVQWKYAFGTNLPTEPPPEFRVDEKSVQSSGDLKIEPGARTRYWQKLRQFWGLPQAWDQSFTWNTGWLRGTSGSRQNTGK